MSSIRSQAIRDRRRSSSRRIMIGLAIIAVAIGGLWALVRATMPPAPIPATTYTWSEFELPGRGEVGNLRHLTPETRELWEELIRLKEFEERPMTASRRRGALRRYMRASLGHHVTYSFDPLRPNVWK